MSGRAEAELAAVIAGLTIIENSARYRVMEGGLKQPLADLLKDDILVRTAQSMLACAHACDGSLTRAFLPVSLCRLAQACVDESYRIARARAECDNVPEAFKKSEFLPPVALSQLSAAVVELARQDSAVFGPVFNPYATADQRPWGRVPEH